MGQQCLNITLRDRMSLISDNSKGVALALVSTGLFVVVGVLVRMLSNQIDLFQILLFRQLVFIAVLLPAMIKGIMQLLRPQRAGLHALRITGAFFALYLGFVTVSNLPLADATALGFTQVLFVALISRLFLDEAVGVDRQLTLLLGFTGVMLVVQPDFRSADSAYILAGIGGALAAAVAVVCVRAIAKSESRLALLAYQAVFVGVAALVPAALAWRWPSSDQWLLLLGVGLISSVAQWFGVGAYRLAEANRVANVEYVKIIWSLLLGYLLFAEIPGSLALIGAVVLLASGLIPLAKALVLRRTKPQEECS